MTTDRLAGARAPARTVLVTGGSRGIGAATVRALARAGYQVGFTYRERGELADALIAELAESGARALAVRADVADEADVVNAFDVVTRELGVPYGLVNNAGATGGPTRFVDVGIDAIRTALDTNVLGAMLCAREAVRRMSSARGGAGGAIVNISSGAVRSGAPNVWVHYAATKGAIDTLTLGLAREVAAEGIRVNAVRPGLTATDMLAASSYWMTHGPRVVPVGRLGTPEEIATAVLWLLDPAGTFVTGAILDATGGS